MEYLLLWVVFGAAASSVAKGKNRSVPLWFFIGLLLGPFAALLVAILKKQPGPDQGYS